MRFAPRSEAKKLAAASASGTVTPTVDKAFSTFAVTVMGSAVPFLGFRPRPAERGLGVLRRTGMFGRQGR